MTDDVNILKLGQTRIFIQVNGSSPSNPYLYFGCLSMDGLKQPLGDAKPVYCPSPEVRNKWDIVDTVPSVQALPTAGFTQRMDRYLRDAWWDIRKKGCTFNLIVAIDSCARPDDLHASAQKIIIRNTRLTEFDLPLFNPLSGNDNDAANLTGSLQIQVFDRFTGIQFGEVADTTILAEALDAVFADTIQCGECGTPSDGCQHAYVLTVANSGSPGLSSQIVHTLNKFLTTQSLDIPTLGGLSGNRLAQVGNKLVVISQAANSHHWALLTNVDANTPAWTKVSSGYVASKGPRAIWSKSPAETFVAAAGGYIYFMSNPQNAVVPLTDGSVTTQDLNDIHGLSRFIVAVGNNNAVLVSPNGGSTWSLKTGPVPGVALNAVFVISSNIWWIGTANGKLYYTIDGGASFTDATPDPNLTTITDIRFVDDVVGYVAGQTGGTGVIYRTADNGNTWIGTTPYITALPTAERYNVVVPCDYNTVLTAGRKTAGGDGIVCVGA